MSSLVQEVGRRGDRRSRSEVHRDMEATIAAEVYRARDTTLDQVLAERVGVGRAEISR